MPPRVRRPLAVALLVALQALAACGDGTRRAAADTVQDTVVADPRAIARDSAAADDAAFDELPPPLRTQLDLRRHIARLEAPHDTSRILCQQMGAPTRPEYRRRFRLRIGGELRRPDTTVILFVRAKRPTAALERIELLRNPLGGQQRGFIWTSTSNELQSVEWTGRGANETSSFVLPAGTPAPRVVRALGRRLLAATCEGPRVALPDE